MKEVHVTNEQWVRTAKTDELAAFLCSLTYCCECPYRVSCTPDRVGYVTWLKAPHE